MKKSIDNYLFEITIVLLSVVAASVIVYGTCRVSTGNKWCRAKCQDDTMVYCSLPIGGTDIAVCAKKDRSMYAIPKENP